MDFNGEKRISPMSGFAGLALAVVVLLIGIFLIIGSSIIYDRGAMSGFLFGCLLTIGILVIVAGSVMFAGLKVVNPNEALVLSLFGRYYGTIYESGFYFVNPFCLSIYPKTGDRAEAEVKKGTVSFVNRKVSTKISTWANGSQKVNDALGNPVEVSAIVTWRVVDATKAVILIDNYFEYLSNQTDSTIRNVARLYPYDNVDDKDEKEVMTLRGDAETIAEEMKAELQKRVSDSGLEIMDVRLNQIAYAPEIAAAMLQRQQAVAIIAARQKIVEGAVSMVEMALEQLKRDNVVDLDEERKAQMVSNLLVVLCGSKEANPIVNAGSIY